jgi:hypothetical protein
MRIQWISVLIGLSLDMAVLVLAWQLLEPRVVFRNRLGSTTTLQQVCGDARVEKDAVVSHLNAVSKQHARWIFSIERHIERWKADR